MRCVRTKMVRPLPLVIALVLLIQLLPIVSAQTYLVYGKIVDEKGKPIPEAIIDVIHSGFLVTTTRTDYKGDFNLRLSPGEYILRIHKIGYELLEVELVLTREKAGNIGTFILKSALSIIPESSNLEVLQGDVIPIRISLKNNGVYPLNVYFNIHAPRGWEGYIKSPSGLTVKNIILKEGENKTVILNVFVSRNAVGRYFVNLSVSWVNFTVTLPIEFNVHKRDWRLIETPYTQIEAYPGKTLKIPLTVRNTLGVDSTVKLMYSAPKDWPIFLVDKDGTNVDSVFLGAGETRDLLLEVHVPLNASLSLASVHLVAVAKNASSEVDLKINVQSRFDLVEVDAPVTTLKGVGGENLTLPIRIKNLGSLPSTFLLSYSCEVADVRVFFKNSQGAIVDKVTLNPEEKEDLTLLVKIPPYISSGAFNIVISAKGRFSFSEANIHVEIVGQKDFEVQTQNFGVSVAPGSSTNFVVTIRNTGSMAINSLRVFPVDIPKGIEAVVEEKNMTLLPGEEKRVIIRVKVADKTIEGFYNVPIVIDADGIRKQRILVVHVQSESGLSYFIFALIIIALSFGITLYSRYYRKG